MRDVDTVAFGRRFQARREICGYTQHDLAVEVGMKQQGIQNIEAGKVSRPRLLPELARVLGTSEAWLLWEEGSEQTPEDIPAILRLLERLPVGARQRVLRFAVKLAEKQPQPTKRRSA